jgi:hypothetical protein
LFASSLREKYADSLMPEALYMTGPEMGRGDRWPTCEKILANSLQLMYNACDTYEIYVSPKTASMPIRHPSDRYVGLPRG